MTTAGLWPPVGGSLALVLAGSLSGMVAGCGGLDPGAKSGAGASARAPLRLAHGGSLAIPEGPDVRFEAFSEERPAAVAGQAGAAVAVVTFQIDDDALELALDPARPEAATGWADDFRLSLVSADHETVEMHVDRRTEEVVPDSARSSRVARKQTIPLGDGLHLRFSGHSHKQVMSGGPESPLIVYIDYLRAVAVASDPTADAFELVEAGRHDLFPPEQSSWVWRDHQVHMTHHLYNGRMDLELARRKMVPVSLTPAD